MVNLQLCLRNSPQLPLPHRACIKSDTHCYADHDSEPNTITKPSTCRNALPTFTPPQIALHRMRVIRVYDVASDVIETHEQRAILRGLKFVQQHRVHHAVADTSPLIFQLPVAPPVVVGAADLRQCPFGHSMRLCQRCQSRQLRPSDRQDGSLYLMAPIPCVFRRYLHLPRGWNRKSQQKESAQRKRSVAISYTKSPIVPTEKKRQSSRNSLP